MVRINNLLIRFTFRLYPNRILTGRRRDAMVVLAIHSSIYVGYRINDSLLAP
jgi:hypothetical protein